MPPPGPPSRLSLGLGGLLALVALGGSGCADPGDPQIYGTRFALVYDGRFPGTVADLDRDGRHEVVLFQNELSPGVGAVIIETLEGQAIEQVNVEGEVLGPSALDLDGDDTQEVLIPYLRENTLFVRVVNDRGQDRFDFPLVSGRDRVEPDGSVLPWRTAAPTFGVEDVDGDGARDLVAVVATDLARAPRGVFAYALPSGQLIDSLLVGAPFRLHGFRDYDGDGVREVAVGSRAPDNGASAGRLTDDRSYVGVVRLGDGVDVEWRSELGGLQTEAEVYETDLDGDGRPELLAVTFNRESARGRLRLYDPASGETLRDARRAFRHAAPARVRGGPPVVFGVDATGLVSAYDSDFNLVETTELSLAGQTRVTGAGDDRVFVRGEEGEYWVDADLAVRGLLPAGPSFGVVGVHEGVGGPLYEVKRDGRLQVYRLEANRLWWVYRYGAVGGGLIGLGLLAGGGGLLLGQRRRIAHLKADLAMLRGKDRAFDEVAWRLTARRVVHDLRNPLTSILLNAETLRRAALDDRDPAAAERYARRIEERVERLRGVTRNFLKFVDLEEPSLREVAAGSFLVSVAEGLREDVPPDVDLVVRTDEAAPSVRLDPEQMGSVIENLVSNAVNALPDGGRITLAVHSAQALQVGDDPALRDWAVLEVRDAGTGIDPAVRDRLFEPGVTGTAGGAGFGLAVVRKTVADHGGHVEVESEPGAGTVVSVYLPAVSFDRPSPP